MEQGFFILREGQKRGPYTAEELKLMQIQKMDLIALSENAAWTEVVKVKELQYLFEKEKNETSTPFVGFFLNWLYFSLQNAGDSEQTIGQKALNIKLVSANGRKIEFGQATGRFFGNLLNCLTLGVGFLMFFFSSRNQCLHDSISNTLVVSELKRERH